MVTMSDCAVLRALGFSKDPTRDSCPLNAINLAEGADCKLTAYSNILSLPSVSYFSVEKLNT